MSKVRCEIVASNPFTVIPLLRFIQLIFVSYTHVISMLEADWSFAPQMQRIAFWKLLQLIPIFRKIQPRKHLNNVLTAMRLH